MRRIIVAARDGKSILEFPVYDGSESGEKLYNTLTVIGRPIAPGDKPPNDAAAKIPELAKLKRWPVTISYFEQQSAGRSRPANRRRSMPSPSSFTRTASRARWCSTTAISASSGEMTSLELKDPKPCPMRERIVPSPMIFSADRFSRSSRITG